MADGRARWSTVGVAAGLLAIAAAAAVFLTRSCSQTRREAVTVETNRPAAQAPSPEPLTALPQEPDPPPPAPAAPAAEPPEPPPVPDDAPKPRPVWREPRLRRTVFELRSPRARQEAAANRKDAEEAIARGLAWLTTAQQEDGRWIGKAGGGERPGYDVGVTGLVILAFQGAGHHANKGPFKPAIRKGIDWLIGQMEPDGKFRYRVFYEQGIATMALCEAYALTRDPRVGHAAQRALDHIQAVQPDHGGFRYQGAVEMGGGDLSCSGWQLMAMALGTCAELTVRDAAFTRSRTLLDNTWRGNGGSAYVVNSPKAGSLACSSIGLLARTFLSDREEHDEQVRQAAILLFDSETEDGKPVPGGKTGQLVKNLYYTFYSSLAMYQAGDATWAAWDAMVRPPLVAAQVAGGVEADGPPLGGSWDPARHQFAGGAGRAYATAMAILCLETPYRFRRVYRGQVAIPAEF